MAVLTIQTHNCLAKQYINKKSINKDEYPLKRSKTIIAPPINYRDKGNKFKSIPFKGLFSTLINKFNEVCEDNLFESERHFDKVISPYLLDDAIYEKFIGRISKKTGLDENLIIEKTEKKMPWPLDKERKTPHLQPQDWESLLLYDNDPELKEAIDSIKEFKKYQSYDSLFGRLTGLSSLRNEKLQEAQTKSMACIKKINNKIKKDNVEIKKRNKEKDNAENLRDKSLLHKEAYDYIEREENALKKAQEANQSVFAVEKKIAEEKQNKNTYKLDLGLAGKPPESWKNVTDIIPVLRAGGGVDWSNAIPAEIDLVKAKEYRYNIGINQAKDEIRREFDKRMRIANTVYFIKHYVVKDILTPNDVIECLQGIIIKPKSTENRTNK